MVERQGGDVAVKVMQSQYANNTAYQDRFEREATLGMKLEHPNIVSVHDLVLDGGNLALVMDLVAGRPLSELVGTAAGPILWDRAWPLFSTLLDAVGYAHAQGVVHRDLKPDNVLVTADGEPHVIDFGIAKDMDSSGTRTGTGMGTVEYMAPEQYTAAKTVNQGADIYSLGMILYEMLAGRLPWDETATQYQIMQQKAEQHIVSPRDLCPLIAPEIAQAVLTALAPDPANRIASTAAFSASLTEASHRAAARDNEEKQRKELEKQRAAEREARRAAAESIPVGVPLLDESVDPDDIELELLSEDEPVASAAALTAPRTPRVTVLEEPLQAAPGNGEFVPARPTAADRQTSAIDYDWPQNAGKWREVSVVVLGLLLAAGGMTGIYFGVLQTKRVSLDSDPAGAEVTHRATGDLLGVTPIRWSAADQVPHDEICVYTRGFWRQCLLGASIVDVRKSKLNLVATQTIGISSEPSGAIVDVLMVDPDGRATMTPVGTTPLDWRVPGRVARSLDAVEFRVSKEGYGTRLEQVSIEQLSAAQPLSFDLHTAGVLSISSSPAGAEVSVQGPGGSRDGVTPLALADLSEGTYTIEARLDRYPTERTTVDVTAGAEERVRLRFVHGGTEIGGMAAATPLHQAQAAGIAVPKATVDKHAAESTGILSELNTMEAENNMFGTGGVGVGASAFVGGVVGSKYGNQYGAGSTGSRDNAQGGGKK